MKRRKMRGGVRFGTLHGTPQAIGPDLFPRKLWVPLRQGYGEAAKPLVEPGGRVLAGQIIGRDDEVCSSPVHSPVSGRVEEIASLDGSEDGERCIVIAADEMHDRAERRPIGPDFEKSPPEAVSQALYEAGVTALGRAGIPSPFNSSSAQPETIDTIIVPLLETSPLACGVETRIHGRWKEFASGIRALRHALSAERVILAYADERVRAQVVPWLNQLTNTQLRRVTDRYPQDRDEMLVETLTDRRVPDDGLSTEVGVVCVSVGTALAAHAAVLFGQPVIRQEVALGGSGVTQPEILTVPIGAPVSELVSPRKAPGAEIRIIFGDCLTGGAVPEGRTPVPRGLGQVSVLLEKKEPELFAFLKPGMERHSYSQAFLSSLHPGAHYQNDTSLNGEERPCICCNYCDEVCPRNLMPYQLSKLVRIEEIEEARQIRLTACIECGLCSYVCPSKIPLLEDIRRGKQMLAEELAHEQAT